MSLSAHAAHALLKTLRRVGRSLLLEELAQLDADDLVIEQLLLRLERASAQKLELGYSYAFLISWLIARIGPHLGGSCEEFELEVSRVADTPETQVVTPRWALSVPAEGALLRRVPCTPFVEGDDAELAHAYRGLVDHIAFVAALPDDRRKLELLNSAIPWRVVALADRLEPEEVRRDGRADPIATRLERLKGRTVGGANTSKIERDWWRTLGGGLCSRRHALSHLGETSDGWTFTKCMDAMWTLDEARTATASIALAILDRVAKHLRGLPPDRRILDEVLDDRSTAWLDEYGGR